MTSLPPILRERTVRIPKSGEVVADQIRKAIIRGELKEGDNLPAEASLIEIFEISRPTIREAVRILESEGLITVSRGWRGGARVNAPTFDMVARSAGIALQSMGATIGDLYEARTVVEPMAARMAAERNGKAAAAVLRVHLEKELSLVHDRAGASQAIAEFHKIMMEQSGNISLIMVAHALQGLVARHLQLAQRREPLKDVEALERRMRFGLRSHAKLIDLLEACDGEGAERHWRNHMRAAGAYWLAEIAPTAVIELLASSGPL
jgi:DNA-binding FadR family transcriptional regulator